MESSEVGRRNTHGNSNLFVPGERRPLSRRRSSLDESSSTRGPRSRNLLFSSLRALLPRIFLPRTEREKEQEREHLVFRQGDRFENRSSVYTVCGYTSALCTLLQRRLQFPRPRGQTWDGRCSTGGEDKIHPCKSDVTTLGS